MTNVSVFPTAQPTMADLYTRLASIGIPKEFVRDRILPDWWADEVDEDPDVFLQGAMYISRRLNIDLTSLIAGDSPKFISAVATKFKTRSGTDFTKIDAPYALACRIAELTAHACVQPYRDVTNLSITKIRQEILRKYPTISLAGVLNFCWSNGIPVVHFAQFPPKGQRFDGMIASFGGRPIILISRKELFPAKLLFIIAHELGHFLRGHLNADGFWIDKEIQLQSDDEEENEANQVAVELLLGRPGVSYDLWNHYLNAEILVENAKQFAQECQADPGVVALNISWNRAQRARTKKDEGIVWATSTSAQKSIAPEANAPQEINNYLLSSINLESLGEEDRDYLASMLNLSSN